MAPHPEPIPAVRALWRPLCQRWSPAALLLGLLLAPGLAAQERGAAFLTLQVRDPVGGGPMDATLFYPCADPAAGPTRLGPYLVQAGRGLPPAPGRFPLVALSHGHGGSRLGHHDLATWLARHGYVVASVDHPGDNFQDQSGFGTDTVLLGRPLQLSALIDAALAHPLLGPRIDPTRIGAAGFSAGGYTVLALAGARPRFELAAAYCQRHPEDHTFCDLPAAPRRHPEILTVADRRVRAVFAMAPLGIFFDRPALATVQVPVFLYAAAQDQVLLVAENAARVRDLLPAPPVYRSLPGVGHYVFLAPTPDLAATQPELFRDPPGVDRTALHRQINQDALDFFDRELGARLAGPSQKAGLRP